MRAVLILLACLAGPALSVRCSSGWVSSKRPAGWWCMKVYTGQLNQDDSEAKCKALNATLTGIETQAELTKVAEQGKTEMLKTSYKHGYLRVGGERCSLNDPFYWLDRQTIGTDGFKWAAGEPMQANSYGVPYNCLQIWLWVTGGWVTSRNHGEMITNVCPSVNTDRYVGYVCGKVAT